VCFGRTAPYSDVRLIRQEESKKSSQQLKQLIIEIVRGRPIVLTLANDDSTQCFEFFCGVASHAPAIDEFDQVYEPNDAVFAEEARLIVLRRFRQKARGFLLASVALLLFWMYVIAALYFTRTWSNNSRLWFFTVVLPLASARFAYQWLRTRKAMREMTR